MHGVQVVIAALHVHVYVLVYVLGPGSSERDGRPYHTAHGEVSHSCDMYMFVSISNLYVTRDERYSRPSGSPPRLAIGTGTGIGTGTVFAKRTLCGFAALCTGVLDIV